MLKKHQFEQLIKNCELKQIFEQIGGWDGTEALPELIEFTFAGQEYEFNVRPIVQKHGFMILETEVQAMPNKAVRQTLQRKLSRNYHYEHLLVLRDNQLTQIWMVAIKQPNQPIRFVEAPYDAKQTPEALIGKLEGIFFSLDDEKGLTITDVVQRVESAFKLNAQQITRKFYEGFAKQLKYFQEFIKGLQEQVDKEQYAALMLNRLMFIYFIQSKRFLDNNRKYLQTKLEESQSNLGKDKFYKGFYRHFLKTLFHRGLGAPEEQRDKSVQKLIGKVPYLNGGLFDQSELEREYESDIYISDEAFKKLFCFFDDWNWILDNRATASGRDINPDVIGYIFEKYINDRAKMGAYYTQEDITGYIARNTVLAHLLSQAKQNCKEAFDPQNGTIWKLLSENPDEYIYEAVQHGANVPNSDLPEYIRCGLDTNAPNLLQRRKKWNTAVNDSEIALPTETWREFLMRRERYSKLKAKIKNGEITEIQDLITHNLDIEKLTIHFLQQHEDSDLISAFYTAIAGQESREGSNAKPKRGITVLDPACGSGAFLFSALNVLEPLYSECIYRMRGFVEEDHQLNESGEHKPKSGRFRAILREIEQHPTEAYYIYRSIILHNLFGVDIMPEAVEVAKLRLFLKLAAEAKMDTSKPNMGLEPLPDIDFNIRTGNALVGFANMNEVQKSIYEQLRLTRHSLQSTVESLIDEINAQAKSVSMAYNHFVNQQNLIDIGTEEFRESKQHLQKELAKLNYRLNRYLAQSYGIEISGDESMTKWQNSHKPFHWVSEFYGIVETGGFDVVLGNPPYVEITKIEYNLNNFDNSKGNLYAFFMEKSAKLLKEKGQFGMIVPISLPSTKRMNDLRNFITDRYASVYVANFADRPGTLFTGVHQKLTIILGTSEGKNHFTTNFLHWYARTNSNERNNVFKNLYYQQNPLSFSVWQKFGDEREATIWDKMRRSESNISCFVSNKLNSSQFHLNKRLMYWVKCFLAPKESREYRPHYSVGAPKEALVAIFNSSIFFWYWEVFGDCWDLTKADKTNFRFGVQDEDIDKLADLGRELEEDLELKKKYVGTKQIEYEYKHYKSKPIIDEIDKILAKHYGFTEEELDYIINYDYKYRMGGADD